MLECIDATQHGNDALSEPDAGGCGLRGSTSHSNEPYEFPWVKHAEETGIIRSGSSLATMSLNIPRKIFESALTGTK